MYTPEAYNNKYIRHDVFRLIELCAELKQYETRCFVTGTDPNHPMDSVARDYRWALQRLSTFLEDVAHHMEDETINVIMTRFQIWHLNPSLTLNAI